MTASHSSPCFRKQLDSVLVESQLRRLKSENYILPINWESLDKTELGLYITRNLPRDVRDSLLWGSGDTQHSLAGDYNLPLQREEDSSSRSSESIRYELLPRCSMSDSVFYAMRKDDINESRLLLLPDVTSISLTSVNGDDDDISEVLSIENIPDTLQKLINSSEISRTPNTNDEELHQVCPSSDSLHTNNRLNTTDRPRVDHETTTEAVPLVTAGGVSFPNKGVNLKKYPFETEVENLPENVPLLKNTIPQMKELPIGKNKTSESLKKRILDFCGTLCPCCVCTFKK